MGSLSLSIGGDKEMSFFSEVIVDGFEKDCLEQMESLRTNTDAASEESNRILDECIKIVKEVAAKYW